MVFIFEGHVPNLIEPRRRMRNELRDYERESAEVLGFSLCVDKREFLWYH